MSPPHQAIASNQEARVLLAIQAIKLKQFQSIRAAAVSYDIPLTTLHDRIHGKASRRDTPSNAQRLTFQEEEAIIRYILDLDSRGFPPQRKLFKKWQTFSLLNATRL